MPLQSFSATALEADRGLTPAQYRARTGASHPLIATPGTVECPACEREVYPCSDGGPDLFDDPDEYRTHSHGEW